MRNRKLTRRDALKIGLGSVAIVGATTASALESTVTPPQTEGPFYPIRPQDDKDADLTRIGSATEQALGDVVIVAGCVKNENGKPVANAVVDIWQANAAGRYAHENDPNTAPLDPNFQGWAIIKTDAQGNYRFKTVRPGAYPATEGWDRPPHIHYKVSRRGYHEITTQMYFPGDKLNGTDLLLNEVDEAVRHTLIAKNEVVSDDPDTQNLFRFDVIIATV